ncbi:glutathione S-transferase [Thozetella sp. PMI_491]|nr:glutathione S-transferase [Thozetella sp. PMI_491]
MPSTTLPALKLWYSPEACSFAPHVTLLEAGLEAELILAQVGSMTKEFETLNPKLRVPVLAVDDEIITEIPAVLTAIAQLVPDRKFLGRTPIETVRVYEWLNYLSGTVHGQAFGGLWRPERFVKDPQLYPAVHEKALESLKACYSFIEAKLRASGTTYAVGSSFTVVDPFLVVMYRWGSRPKLDMEAAYPTYAGYAKRLLETKSFVEAHKLHEKV